MANTVQDWMDRPLVRPRPPPTPTPAPLRCHTCGEEVFPNGRLRACRCDRRSYAMVVLVFGLPLLAVAVAFILGAR